MLVLCTWRLPSSQVSEGPSRPRCLLEPLCHLGDTTSQFLNETRFHSVLGFHACYIPKEFVNFKTEVGPRLWPQPQGCHLRQDPLFGHC